MSIQILLDGEKMRDVEDFHNEISTQLGIGHFYGKNYHALWDVLSAGIERPVHLRWKASDVSRQRFGEEFKLIEEILERTAQQDKSFDWKDVFSYNLE